MIEGWVFYIITPQDYVATAAELNAEVYEEAFEQSLTSLPVTVHDGFHEVDKPAITLHDVLWRAYTPNLELSLSLTVGTRANPADDLWPLRCGL